MPIAQTVLFLLLGGDALRPAIRVAAIAIAGVGLPWAASLSGPQVWTRHLIPDQLVLRPIDFDDLSF